MQHGTQDPLKVRVARAQGQAMVEYLVVALAAIIILLAPMPSVVPGKTSDHASILTQLSEALRGSYADYSWAASQPIVD